MAKKNKGTFSYLEAQQALDGFNAKKWIKNSNAHLIRKDWEEFNAEWMLL